MNDGSCRMEEFTVWRNFTDRNIDDPSATIVSVLNNFKKPDLARFPAAQAPECRGLSCFQYRPGAAAV